MHNQLTPQQIEACLLLLERALIRIRAACWSKDLDRAEALADAFHNLPRLLIATSDTWTFEGFETIFLGGLIARYPEFAGFKRELPSSGPPR